VAGGGAGVGRDCGVAVVCGWWGGICGVALDSVRLGCDDGWLLLWVVGLWGVRAITGRSWSDASVGIAPIVGRGGCGRRCVEGVVGGEFAWMLWGEWG